MVRKLRMMICAKAGKFKKCHDCRLSEPHKFSRGCNLAGIEWARCKGASSPCVPVENRRRK